MALLSTQSEIAHNAFVYPLGRESGKDSGRKFCPNRFWRQRDFVLRTKYNSLEYCLRSRSLKSTSLPAQLSADLLFPGLGRITTDAKTAHRRAYEKASTNRDFVCLAARHPCRAPLTLLWRSRRVYNRAGVYVCIFAATSKDRCTEVE